MIFTYLKLDTASKIKALIFGYHILFIVGLFHISWSFLALGLVSYFVFGKFGGEIGLHRYFSHRSFATSAIWHKTILLCSLGTGLGSPISWAATHRLHHRNTDKEGDPHSPMHQSSWRVWLTLWKPFLIPRGIVSDLTRDAGQRFIHKHYFSIHVAAILVLAIINPWLPCFVLAWPCVISFHLAGAANVLCHQSGLRNHHILNIFALGDGLHKNHHDHSASYSNTRLNERGMDVSGWFIRTFLDARSSVIQSGR